MEVMQENEGQSSFFLLFFGGVKEADQFFTENSPPLRLMDANVSSVIGSVPQIQINGCCFTGVILSYVKTAVCLYVWVCVCLPTLMRRSWVFTRFTQSQNCVPGPTLHINTLNKEETALHCPVTVFFQALHRVLNSHTRQLREGTCWWCTTSN